MCRSKTFLDEIDEFKPDVVGLSGFLTLAFDSMKETIDAIQEAGLRDNLKIMIGGGQVDEAVRNYTGADASASTPSKPSRCARTGWESPHERAQDSFRPQKRRPPTTSAGSASWIASPSSSPIACRP